MEKTYLKFCKHRTKCALIFMYINGLLLEACHTMYGTFDIEEDTGPYTVHETTHIPALGRAPTATILG